LTVSCEVLVVGGGHAGIEASLAAARLGCDTVLVTHARHEIGRMPCNPAIGGLGKGQLVREIDVLGGEMGLAIDAAGIQFRILNRKKGPAVRSPRAQADKRRYQEYMQGRIEDQEGLRVVEGEAVEILVEPTATGGRRICGATLADGGLIGCRACILCTGTFLSGLMHVGDRRREGGREGADSARHLSGSLRRLGLPLQRLKTGTPPRLHRDSVDVSALTPQPGDADPRPFSFRTLRFAPRQITCHLTHTTPETHRIIRENLASSPLYTGVIEGRGPRYCPSIEDKVVRFSDRDQHLLFLEPEGLDSEEIYINGLSTSLPPPIQERLVHSIPGLEDARILRCGYAVEYDSVPSCEIGPTFESKSIDMFFLSGQIIGTSGYEEAAAQGLVAGINAARATNNQPKLIIRRHEAYIGVLADDLVTKEISEPYRMFTSRAEHRLSLRCDNAESRLLDLAAEIALLPAPELSRLEARVRAARILNDTLASRRVTLDGMEDRMPARGALRMPGVELKELFQNNGDRWVEEAEGICRSLLGDGWRRYWDDILLEVECDLKYEGYIAKQERILRRQAHLDELALPRALDYRTLQAISFEAREKLQRMRPGTLGEASRIDGVRAGDIAVLTVLVRRLRDGAGGDARD
jgi:tRNA uridine 5-carboxymethylaminomethyl modification enzyme